MLINTATQHQGVIAWTGTAARPIDIRRHNNFSFTFEATADLAADAVFNVQSAPPSGADPCAPGTFADVPEIASCAGGAVAAQSLITIPSGTKKGQLCVASIPCRPNAFVQLTGTGAANVLAVATLSGPRGG